MKILLRLQREFLKMKYWHGYPFLKTSGFMCLRTLANICYVRSWLWVVSKRTTATQTWT